MSVRATQWAYEMIETIKISPKAAQVLVALAWLHHQETGRCSPSIGKLVKRTRLSERAVRLALRELEVSGFIVTTHRTQRTGRGKRNLTSFYRFKNGPKGGARRAGGVGHDVPGERAKGEKAAFGFAEGKPLPSCFHDLMIDPDDCDEDLPIQEEGSGGKA